MKARTLLLTGVLVCFAGEARAEDRWWARDKALHFGVSGALAAGGYGAGAIVFDERWQRATSGAALALSLGIAKEVYDEIDYGGASYKDMVFDVAGTAVGLTAAWLIDVAINGTSDETRTARTTQLGFSF